MKMIEIEEPLVKELEKVVYYPIMKHMVSNNAEILRIANEDDLTRIDFIHYADPIYIDGGWVKISPLSFIRPVGTKHKLGLVKAVNIPIAPVKHFYKSKKDFLCYTLYFPPLPKGTKEIDIIEFEGPGDNWFNFYGVSMGRVRSEKIIVGN